jgi:DNA repair protein RadA/Sms
VVAASSKREEAAKVGFTRAFVPEVARGEAASESGLTLTTIGTLASLVADITARGKNRGPRLASEDG